MESPPRAASGEHDVIYDWNRVYHERPPLSGPIALLDETLRDGIQSPSVPDPNINDKIRLLHLMGEIGVDTADVGLPGAGPRAYMDVLDMVNEIVRGALPVKPACAARTLEKDIEPILDLVDKTGMPIEVMAFVGSSPIRHFVEGWDLARLIRHAEDAIRLAVRHGLPVTFVTEDTSRSAPATLDQLFRAAIGAGAGRLCLTDTVGHATPDGTRALVRFTRDVIASTGADVGIDWHGHNDRGMGLINTLWAIESGATRAHGTSLGVGERAGNAALELILMNLTLLGARQPHDVTHLLEYCRVAASALHLTVPANYPLVGRDAFRTATGVHAAAIRKALARGDRWLADRVYSGVPADVFGRQQEIEIAHTSGTANVEAWLEARGIAYDDALVAEVLKVAKRGTRVLEEEEVRVVLAEQFLKRSVPRHDA